MNTELERVNMSLISTETFRLDSENDLHTKMQALQVGEGHNPARVYLGLWGKIGVWLLCLANVIFVRNAFSQWSASMETKTALALANNIGDNAVSLRYHYGSNVLRDGSSLQ